MRIRSSVKGDTISHFENLRKFEEKYDPGAFEINNGFFDPLFGSIELPKPEGEAKTFVICGNGRYSRFRAAFTPFLLQVFYTPMMWITAWQDCWPIR